MKEVRSLCKEADFFHILKGLVHDSDGAVGEIDDLLGDGTKEMRVQAGQSTGTDQIGRAHV